MCSLWACVVSSQKHTARRLIQCHISGIILTETKLRKSCLEFPRKILRNSVYKRKLYTAFMKTAIKWTSIIIITNIEKRLEKSFGNKNDKTVFFKLSKERFVL